MRSVARRAGVSHAAPAHHFGDKTGIFTAIAAEGFRMMTAAIAPDAAGEHGFLAGGIAYVGFALEHPGYFEVMFRPALQDLGDPELVEAREAAFDLLFSSARQARDDLALDANPEGIAIAGWSVTHGFATLVLASNLGDRLGPDPVATVSRGMVALGEITRQALDAGFIPTISPDA
jgi:AcrR family transcriptional regulator